MPSINIVLRLFFFLHILRLCVTLGVMTVLLFLGALGLNYPKRVLLRRSRSDSGGRLLDFLSRILGCCSNKRNMCTRNCNFRPNSDINFHSKTRTFFATKFLPEFHICRVSFLNKLPTCCGSNSSAATDLPY